MEKKTIGGFIAALRKANGMTQKELAEKLHVSDKTVSRWERDDGAPDLSAIPVIAEIFGVTCDELLRGERKPPAERTDEAAENEVSPKGEKQRQRLLAVSLARYRTRTLISAGLSVLGLIAAAIGNLGFLRSYLGFLLGAVFYAAAIVCQMIFLNGTLFSVAEESLADDSVNSFKRNVIRVAQKSVGLTAALFGFTAPLLLGDTYSGLVESWPFFGALGAVLALAVYGTGGWFLNAALLKRGVYTLNEKEALIYRHNHALQRRCAWMLLAVMATTLLFHVFGSEMIWNVENLAKGITFHDYESFVAYMEQPVEYDGSDMIAAPDSAVYYFDGEGNEVSEEDAIRGTLVDKNGTVVCEYLHRNRAASTIRPTVKEGSALPVTVITNEAWRQAWDISGLISTAYSVLYVLETTAVLAYYLKKRMR